jgi:hypothetical protein
MRPSSFVRRVGEGFTSEVYLSIVLRQWRVAFKDKISIGVDVGVSPHPNPLPVGEGNAARFEGTRSV